MLSFISSAFGQAGNSGGEMNNANYGAHEKRNIPSNARKKKKKKDMEPKKEASVFSLPREHTWKYIDIFFMAVWKRKRRNINYFGIRSVCTMN